MVGQELSHYRIEEKLGEGGMGVVYRATDTRLNRPVAIKILDPETAANPERKRRFFQEARAASALNHPNIITVYEIDHAGGIDFIAMEFIRGKTLFELIGSTGLSLDDALKCSVQIADALAAAHAIGIVHRDLKPSNIMVTGPESGRAGLVKVLDFGVAKLTDPLETDPTGVTETQGPDAKPRTAEGMIIGTASYMSPEQAEGKKVDARSDIFSFGSVLYEMLTGKRAFRGDSRLSTLTAILRDDPQPPSQLAGDVPLELEEILSRCLRKDPERRFQSAADLKVMLQEVADRKMVEALTRRPPTTQTATGRMAPVRPRQPLNRIAQAAAAVVVVVALGFGVARLVRLWTPVPAQKHIAILPFQNVGGDSANQAFCDGLVEALSSRLTQLQQFQKSLRVVPASEVRREKISGAREARRTFGVSLVITGSVHRAAGEVRVTANLVDADRVVQLRSRTVRTGVDDLTALQDNVVKEIVDMLELEVAPQAQTATSTGGTAVPGAYDFYVQGRGYLQRFDQRENIDSAITLFQQALEKDPKYALAYAGLGEACWHKYNITKEQQWIEKARKNCGAAIKLDDKLAAAYVTLGQIDHGTGRTDVALRELETAIKLDPFSADGYRELASTYEATGKTDQATSMYRKAIQLRPGYWVGYRDLGAFYYRRGQYAEAATQFRMVVQLTPDNAEAYSALGGVYHLMGRYEDAEAALKKSIGIQPSARAYSNLGTTYYFQRRYADAVTMMEKAVELGASGYLVWGNLGEAYRQTGRAQKAAEAYRLAAQLAEDQLTVNPKDAQVRSRWAHYLAKLGNKQKAQAEIEEALRAVPNNVNILFRSAIVYELIGNRDQALQQLEAALKAGYSIEEIRTAADLDELHKDPRYQRMMQEQTPQ